MTTAASPADVATLASIVVELRIVARSPLAPTTAEVADLARRAADALAATIPPA